MSEQERWETRFSRARLCLRQGAERVPQGPSAPPARRADRAFGRGRRRPQRRVARRAGPRRAHHRLLPGRRSPRRGRSRPNAACSCAPKSPTSPHWRWPTSAFDVIAAIFIFVAPARAPGVLRQPQGRAQARRPSADAGLSPRATEIPHRRPAGCRAHVYARDPAGSVSATWRSSTSANTTARSAKAPPMSACRR